MFALFFCVFIVHYTLAFVFCCMLLFGLHSLGTEFLMSRYLLFFMIYVFLFIWGSVPVDLGGFVLFRYAQSIDVYEPCFASMT